MFTYERHTVVDDDWERVKKELGRKRTIHNQNMLYVSFTFSFKNVLKFNVLDLMKYRLLVNVYLLF